MSGRITGNEYRGVWADVLGEMGIALPGAVGRSAASVFVRECVGCQITIEGAYSEARLAIGAWRQDMIDAAEKTGARGIFTAWSPEGECVTVPYRVEGKMARVDAADVPEWARRQVREFFAEHANRSGEVR